MGELAEIYDGPHATPRKTESGAVFLGIWNLRDGRLDLSETEHLSEADYSRWTRRVTPRPGDVVFSYETRLGQAARVPEGLRCCLGRRMGLLRARDAEIDARFLLYAYLGPQFQETLRSRTIPGSTVDRIPLIEMPQFPLLVPTDVGEQRSIADILSALDEKIELNRRINETLDAMARALFKSWFVDFEPVRAKAEGRKTSLPAALDALFPASLVDHAVLGEIPSGWTVEPIGTLADVVGGSTPSTKIREFWSPPIHCWATPKDLSELRSPVLLDTERRISDSGLAQIGSGLLPPGTVLLSSRAPIGYLVISEVPVAVNQGFIAMQPADRVCSEFLLLWAREAHETILSRANGSTFQEISKANFRPIPVAVPPRPVMNAFAELVGPLHRRVVAVEKENRTLASTRDLLLPKLVSGELRVPDAERIAVETGA